MPRPSLLVVLLFVSLPLGVFLPTDAAETDPLSPLLQTSGVNVALASNGAIATASSTYSEGRPASSVINGDRKGLNWGNGGGWTDATPNEYPDWLQVDFAGIQTISEIDVFTVQDNFSNPAEPTLTMTFSQYGITSFSAQYWDGGNWVTVNGGSVTGNNKVWKKFTFTAVTTTKIRVNITDALNSYSRLVEVEAWTPSQPPAVSITSPATGTVLTNTNPVTINATASDADGTITKLEFFQGATKLGESTSSPYSFVWSNIQPGSYSVTARATDNSNTVTTSSAVSITMPVGWIAGRVTRTDGTTAIAGATVKVYQGVTLKGSAGTTASGDYSVGVLNTGTYTVEASASGYETNTQGGITVNGGTTTLNISLSVPITYLYDALGRLISVIDKDGNAATYSYDAVGNLLSISRSAPTQVSVIQVNPGSGAVGTTVTIYGTGFSPTGSQNTVSFNGVAASVISATLTQVVTNVPQGATTGTVSVTSPLGSATSTGPFTVTSGALGAPTITGFTPTIGLPGTSVTISGTNFETIPSNNVTKFNITPSAISSATANTIVTNVPTTTSGRISVATPAGATASSGDFFVPPSPYTVADVVQTGRIAFGVTKAVAINTANKIGLHLFDGLAGRRVSLNVSGQTMSSQVTILSPDRTVLTSRSFYFWQGDIFFEPATLPVSGTYTILVASLDGTTGGMNLTLYDVPPDTSGTIEIAGSPMTVTLSPGQNSSLTFSASAGQKVSLSTSNSTISLCDVLIKKPDGSQVGGIFPAGMGSYFMDTVILPVSGQYSISIDPRAAYSGSITVKLDDPTDVTATITVGGSPVAVTTTVPGQNAVVTFTGTSAQRVSLNFTGKTFIEGVVTVTKPDGSSLYSQFMPNSLSSAFMDSTSLPASGTYTIRIDPSFQFTGSITMTLYNTTADVTGTITVGGPPLAMNIPTPGQNGLLTFSGTAGHRIGLNMTSVTITSLTITIKKPDGTNLASIGIGVGGGFLETSTLPVTGTYTILVDPSGNSTGNVTLTLTDISDVTGTITPGGAPLTLTNTAGQDMRVNFTGAVGQRISLKINISMNCFVSIYKPDGAPLISQIFISGGSGVGFIDATVLPLAGNYVIIVDIQSTASGSATFALYDVPADVTGTIGIGVPQPVTITTPGQNAALTFSGTAGQRISLRMTSVTITSCTVYIKKPDGSVLAQVGMGTGGAFIDKQTLPVTGTYTILIDPSTYAVGNTTQTLYDPSDFTGSVTIGGSALTVTISSPGQNGQITFNGTSGQQVTVRITSNTLGIVTVTLLKPDGSQLTSFSSSASSFNLTQQTLPTSGTYKIIVDPIGANTGALNVNVTSP